MMKKSIFYLIPVSFVLVLSIFYFNSQNSDSVNSNELTSENKIKGEIYAELKHIEFEDLIADSDLIAKVKIGKVIEEFEEPMPKSLLEAEIVKVIKGDSELTSIQVLQKGNSNWRFNENEMLQEGSEYVLLLRKSSAVKQPNSFWIYGEEMGIYIDLGNGLLKKAAYPEPLLSAVEDITLSKKLTAASETKAEIQIVNEDQFYELLKKYINN